MKPLIGAPEAATEHHRAFNHQREHVVYFAPPIDDELGPKLIGREGEQSAH